MLAKDEAGARKALAGAIAMVREGWEAESTANNLKLISEARERRGEPVAWAALVEKELLKKTAPPAS